MPPLFVAYQNFAPVKQICAHFNAFHVYASDPKRCVESNHYCSHLNEGATPSFLILAYPTELRPSMQMFANASSMTPQTGTLASSA